VLRWNEPLHGVATTLALELARGLRSDASCFIRRFVADEGGFVDTMAPTGVRKAASKANLPAGVPSVGTGLVPMMLQSAALLLADVFSNDRFETGALAMLLLEASPIPPVLIVLVGGDVPSGSGVQNGALAGDVPFSTPLDAGVRNGVLAGDVPIITQLDAGVKNGVLMVELTEATKISWVGDEPRTDT